ncbi:hypothetical protein BH09VER1_BH09VER1_29920 [soil metagenome]
MRSAARIALLYAILSGIYILVSDSAARIITGGDSDLLTEWQSMKGLAFVAASSLIIFLLVLHYAKSRDRAQALLEQARWSFEQLFQRNPLPLFVYEIKGMKFLAVNQAAVEAYGFSQEEFLNMKLTQIHEQGDFEKLLAHVTRIKPYPYIGHWRHLHKDGTTAEVEIISHPMLFAGSETRLVAAVDISRQKLAEQVLAETMEARGEAEAAKTQFLATVSHEMRTPLNAVTGFIDLLNLETDPVKRREYVLFARQGAVDLLGLIERLINAAALTAKVARKDAAEIEVKSFLRRLGDDYFHPARRKSIKLDVVLEDYLPERALVDAHRLDEALRILLENAIKFSHAGTVTLRAWPEMADEKMLFKISVADQGIGIPPSQQARVFDSFFQVDRDLTRKYGGAGLGLFVAKQLCDLLGATLEVESREAVGSTFTITLAGPLDAEGLFTPSEDGEASPAKAA